MKKASKPIFYTGGGVVNSGPKASELLRELVSTNWDFQLLQLSRTRFLSW